VSVVLAYKLLRKRKNGTLGSLFINRKAVIPIGEWLKAENHPTKGYAERMGWHATLYPYAPHLSKKGRVWAQVFIGDYKMVWRPESQGGTWLLGNYLMVI